MHSVEKSMRWSADQSFKRHLYEEEKSLHRDYSYAMECISDKATTQNALHIKKKSLGREFYTSISRSFRQKMSSADRMLKNHCDGVEKITQMP